MLDINAYRKSPKKQAEFLAAEITENAYRATQHIPVLKQKVQRTHYGNHPILSISEGREIIRNAVELSKNRGGGTW